MKMARAEAIARSLNDTRKWHVHGNGISMDVISRDLKLLINDFGEDENTSGIIRAYNDLLTDYVGKILLRDGVVHVNGQFWLFA